MKVVKSILSGIAQWFIVRRTALLIWAAVAIAAFVLISVNRSQDAAIIADLSSTNESARDARVLDLARTGRLAAVLISTEDPTGDANSAQNVLSAQIRTDAGASLVKVAPNLSSSEAFAALYSMQKDSVTAPDAVTGLATLGKSGSRNLRTLAEGLSDGDPDVRAASVAALTQIGGSGVVALASPLIKDDVAQDSALATLAGVGKPAIPVLSDLLLNESNKESLRESAATALGQIGDPLAASSLEAAAGANPPVPELRRVCLTSLASIVLATVPAPSTVPPTKSPDIKSIDAAEAESPLLVASVLNDKDDSFARSRESLALGRLANPQAIGALVSTLSSYDLRLAAAAKAGVESVGEAAVPQLAACIHSSNLQVRVAAASALAVIGDNSALSAVSPALDDPAPSVRKAAAEGLGRSKNLMAVAILAGHLGDSDGSVAATVSNSLHELGQPAIGVLIAALRGGKPDSTSAFFASQALSADGSGVIAPLVAASGAAASEQKIWIAVTLGAIHDRQAKPALEELSQDASPRVKWAAAQGLEQYKGES